uniref:Uncharacterized protein n=1 Tax=Anguilla anguilla TaxID=7936 RepID=A0A0E9R3A4_ANGAN
MVQICNLTVIFYLNNNVIGSNVPLPTNHTDCNSETHTGFIVRFI